MAGEDKVLDNGTTPLQSVVEDPQIAIEEAANKIAADKQRVIDARKKSDKEEEALRIKRRVSGSFGGGFGQSAMSSVGQAVKDRQSESQDSNEHGKQKHSYKPVPLSEDPATKTTEPDPISDQINVLLGTLQNAKPGDPIREQVRAALAMVNQGATAAFVEGHYNGLKAAKQAELDYRNTVIKDKMSAYWLANGDLNTGSIEAKVSKLIGDKPETSSGALDQLKANGAGQMDMPDLPETDKAAMTEMIISSLADTGKNIALMLGGGQNMQAAALATSASERSFESASNWMAMDLANYKQKKDKVTALNFELAEKYKGDIINMTAEFEQRASADERAYNQLRIKATLQEYDTAWKIMGMDKASLDRIGQIGIEIDNAKNRVEEINTGRQQQVELENARLRQAIGANIAAIDKALMAERKLRIAGVADMVKKMKGLDGHGINGSLHSLWFTNQLMNLDPSDSPIISAGSNAGLRAFANIRRVVQQGGDFTPDNGNQAVENLAILAQKKLIPNNFNDETIKTLGTTKLDMSMSADVISANTKLDLQALPENNSTHVYFVGSLLNAAGSALEVDANDKVQTAKNTKSELMKSNPYGI